MERICFENAIYHKAFQCSKASMTFHKVQSDRPTYRTSAERDGGFNPRQVAAPMLHDVRPHIDTRPTLGLKMLGTTGYRRHPRLKIWIDRSSKNF